MERWINAYPLPKMNPDVISGASVVMALLFVSAVNDSAYGAAWLFLFFHLLLDSVDGAVARRYRLRTTKEQQRHGQLVDLTADRISEGILFLWTPFFTFWAPFFLINTVLAFVQYRTQRAYVLPFRQIFFVVFTVGLLL